MTNPISLAEEIISLLDNSGATIEEKGIALDVARAIYKYVPKLNHYALKVHRFPKD